MPIVLQGFKELNAALTKMGDGVPKRMPAAVDRMGSVILTNAHKRAKGKLKNSLEQKKATSSNSTVLGQLQVKRGFAYAVPYELGHYLVAWGHPTKKHIRERPFMRPGADESIDEIERIAIAETDIILNEFGG